MTTAVFRAGPLVLLATTLVSGLFVPLLGGVAPVSFPYDFVLFAYLWGLGRLSLMLAALDTGSSFEGMGASREATYSALVEPGLFLVLGTLAAASGHRTFADLLAVGAGGPARAIVVAGTVVALFVVLQVEAARVPVDDPTTHLELTMIHEAMILEYSGRHLALIEWAASLKLFAYSCIGLALFLPWGVAQAQAPLEMLLAVPILAGKLAAGGAALAFLETMSAKMRIFRVPEFLATAFLLAVIGLLVHILLGS